MAAAVSVAEHTQVGNTIPTKDGGVIPVRTNLLKYRGEKIQMAYCAYCKEKISIWGNSPVKTIDGITLCYDCAKALSFYNNPTQRYDQLISLIEEKNDVSQIACSPDTELYFEDQLFINTYKDVFGISGKGGLTYAAIGKFKSIEYHEEVEDVQIETQKASSGAGRAVAGAILFGPVGAIAGGLSGRKSAQYQSIKRAKYVGFIVRLTDDKVEPFNLLRVCSGYDYVGYGSDKYQQAKLLAESMIEKLTERFSPQRILDGPSNNMSAIEALERLGNLRAAGILAEDEFASKKANILAQI